MKNTVINLKKILALSILLSTSSVYAFQIESGEYEKKSNSYDDVAYYSYLSEWNKELTTVKPNFKIVSIDQNNIIIDDAKNSKRKRFYSPIVINLSKNGIEEINNNAILAIKRKYSKNSFAEKVQSISTELISDTNNRMDFSVHIDLAFQSVFGSVDNVRITTDWSLENSTCKHLIRNEKEVSDKKGNIHFDINESTKNISCIKMTSFKNARITDFQSSLDSKLNKVVAFAADVAIQLMLSAVQVEDILIKK